MTHTPAACTLPRGFAVATAGAAIKKPGRDDMALVLCPGGATLAAMYTTNRVCAAPVAMSREHLATSGGKCRALLINSGCANAATGAQGRRNAQALAQAVADACGAPLHEVQHNSTGVIGVQLPMDRMLPCIPTMVEAAKAASTAAGAAAEAAAASTAVGATASGRGAVEQLARAIMTTDTYPKMASRTIRHDGRTISVVGVAKGAGMIHPNMATMIAAILTDAQCTPAALAAHLRAAVDRSFHRISIDGDTSTNDSIFALASGLAGEAPEAELRTAIIEVARELALLVVRDGEGYERGIHVRVTGARTQDDALAVARTIASSLLVRCAVTGGDPNWGRILAAAGRSGVAIDEPRLDLSVGGVPLFAAGQPSTAPLADREAAFRAPMVDVHLDLGQGTASDEFISCGLTKAYVELNADYTT